MKEAVLYEKRDSSIRCIACKQYCIIKDGGTGICGVRKNNKGKLYLLVYGKATAVNVDPIEKKPLFHFLPGSKIFSVGTVGCNFACSFCQNWDLSQATKQHKNTTALGHDLSPEDIVNYALEHRIQSIAYTYNEPVIFFEYAYDTAVLAHKNNIKNVFVSNGYESEEALKKINGLLDAINIDLKSFSDDFYIKTCRARLEPVLETIRAMHKNGIWTEITTLVIPGENDSDKELTQIAEFIASVSTSIPWHVTRFHPDYKMKNKTPTPMKTLEKAYDIGKKAGLKYVYVGNVKDARENTYCPSCNAVLIERSGFSIHMNMNNNRCGDCGCIIDGIF